jgi:hypothetical protein
MHLQRRLAKIQAKILMYMPISIFFIQINPSAQAIIKVVIKLNMVANPDRHPNSKGIFDPLGAPLSKVFDHMCKRGHLKPLNSIAPPNPLPKHWDRNLYCHFHQRSSHNTDDCLQLKHEIQDFINQNVIILPAREAKDVVMNGCA